MLMVYFAAAYLLGSIPTSVWVGRIVFHQDIRNLGSGNAGATNSLRCFGARWASFILFVDIIKGSAAAALSHFCTNEPLGPFNYALLLGLTAVVGHIFPVFAGFRGGKGVATMLGTMMVVSLPFTLMACAVFFFTYFSCRYVAVASIVSMIAFATCVLVFITKPLPYVWVSHFVAIVCALVIIAKHHTNIRRLLHKTENKTYFRKSKPKR